MQSTNNTTRHRRARVTQRLGGACLLGILWASILTMPGCRGETDPLNVVVQGEVTWNGKPLRKGFIVFDSEDGGGIPSQGEIIDGKYCFKASRGPRIVRIQANRTYEEVGENPQNLPIAYIPHKYNIKSTLRATVVEGEENTFSFDLQEK